MHLVVVQHGLWGNHHNTEYLAKLLGEKLGADGYHVLNSNVSESNLTYDGIDVCGDRLYDLIMLTHEELRGKGTPVHAISLVGYSMGGLITRYVVGKLYAHGYFSAVRPVNFITVATPHLGAWRLPSSWFSRAYNYMVPVVTSRTGYQLVLQDQHTWGKPLLCILSHPRLLFMRGLALFEQLLLMANVFHDRPVPYCTAAIRLDNPYEAVQPVPVDPRYPSIVRPSGTPVGPNNVHCTLRLACSAATGAKPAGKDGAATAAAAALASHMPRDPTDTAVTVAAEAGEGGGDAAAEAAGTPAEPLLPADALTAPPAPRPLRSTYLRWIFVIFLPLAIPAIILMTITGRRHFKAMSRQALDFSWIGQYHEREQQGADGGPPAARAHTAAAGACEGGQGGARSSSNPGKQAAAGAGGEGDDVVSPDDVEVGLVGPVGGSVADAAARDIPAAPRPPVSRSGSGAAAGAAAGTRRSASSNGAAAGGAGAAAPAAGSSEHPGAGGAAAAAAGGAGEGEAAAAGGGGGGGGAPRSSAQLVGAASAPLDEDGEDGVVVSEQVGLLQLRDGIVEVPGELHRVQEWLVEQLNSLPWTKVDVDCRDLHAHAAIIMRNPSRFAANRDTMDFLVDAFVRA